jgi:hypothetical protein
VHFAHFEKRRDKNADRHPTRDERPDTQKEGDAMMANEILRDLTVRGVILSADGEQLNVDAPDDLLTDESIGENAVGRLCAKSRSGVLGFTANLTVSHRRWWRWRQYDRFLSSPRFMPKQHRQKNARGDAHTQTERRILHVDKELVVS